MSGTTRDITETAIIPAECSERFLPLASACARPLRERGVILAGVSELRAPFDIGRCDTTFHAILYTLEGGARVETPDFQGSPSQNSLSQSALRPGDLWIGPARHAYRYRAEKYWKVLWFHLDDSARWQALRAREIGVHASLPQRALCQATEEFLTETIHADASGSQGDALDALDALDAWQAARAYAEIIGVYLDRIGREERPPAQARQLHDLNLLWEKVDADLAFPWAVETMAARLHLSPTHFHRVVLRHYQATPMQVVARLRMRRAGEMLRGSDDTIERIALAIGYSTSVSFSKAFARHFGQSPGKFRDSSGCVR